MVVVVEPSEPFRIAVPKETVTHILQCVRAYPWERFRDAGGWSAGTSVSALKRLLDYWTTRFDWEAVEQRLNRVPQYRALVDGLKLHFLHVRGSAHRPLLLIHGWPGSFVEFADVVESLAFPERSGGDAADGFDVVVVSLPGFAFSDAPVAPMGPRAMARLFHKLMTQVLGYHRFLAQGGDWGSAISGWLAHDFPQACAGIHLNMALVQRGDLSFDSEEERAYAARRGFIREQEGAYALLQGTKPQTLSFAMLDNPVGVSAWILEKFVAWSDVPRPGGEPDIQAAFTSDQLLANIMTYLVTDSFQTSTWIYKGRFDEGSVTLPPAAYIDVPTGIAAFPDPVFRMPPRSLLQKSYRVTHWTDMPAGGHFAAMEAPQAFVRDLRVFARGLDWR